MKISILSTVLSVCLFYLALAKQSELEYSTILDHDNKVRLEWSQPNESKRILFKLVILSYEKMLPMLIGFGMSDRGEFENADLVLFRIKDTKSRVKVYDSHTDSNGVLHRDQAFNYNFVEMKAYTDQLEIYFDRLIDTCDPNDYQIEAGTVHLIHFLVKNTRIGPRSGLFDGNFRPLNDSDTAEMKQSQLIRSTYYENTVFDPTDYSHFEILNDNVKLPGQETTYWCKVYKLDDLFVEKHHIVAFEAAISNSSRGIVHHMEVFLCQWDPVDHMKQFSGECKSEAKPAGLEQCRKVIAAWAMGASRFVYPPEVGGILGGESFNSLYVVLEVHFDNPGRRSDIHDSSGMRIFYQGGSLRKYDAGIMEIGLEYNAKNSIPPGQSDFHLHGYCLSECTKAALPRPDGIVVFASQLHTHLTGRRVWTSLIREHKVVEIINSDNHYDQMFQEIRLLREPVRVRPGDMLVNTCVFDTRSRVNMTFGGYSIRDEMCVNYMHYYPASSLEVCKSSISDSILKQYFERMSYLDKSNTSGEKSVEDNFNSIRWTPLTSSVLSALYDLAPISLSCNSSDGRQIEAAYWNGEKRRSSFEIKLPDNLSDDYAPVDQDLLGKCDEYD